MQGGIRYELWQGDQDFTPSALDEARNRLFELRGFTPVTTLTYGDHGLDQCEQAIFETIKAGKRIALYADYDVDGTMSCVSWIWFFNAIGHSNFVPYIPCRFKEGYGLNLQAMEHLIDGEQADLIITMDTGITANAEAAYCKERGIPLICTDHHKIQPDKMPDCLILNPKTHPDPDYQELCGCGITFVLLRRLGKRFDCDPNLWTDLLALAGMATICDVVPLNPINHRLASLGVKALSRSNRVVLKELMKSSSIHTGLDETDVGFRLGPRINAVGRLDHAQQVLEAFTRDDPSEFIALMEELNEKRKKIQSDIYDQAVKEAEAFEEDPIIFLGGDWHPGVLGIAASKVAEKFWKPVFMFARIGREGKGSARSIPGFDVTSLMMENGDHFTKFGGHQAAGGFSFPLDNEDQIRTSLCAAANRIKATSPLIWQSKVAFDFKLPLNLINHSLLDFLDELKPFGHAFEAPLFLIAGKVSSIVHYRDKQTGTPKHTAIQLEGLGHRLKIMLFNEVVTLVQGDHLEALVEISKNYYRGQRQVNLIAKDIRTIGEEKAFFRTEGNSNHLKSLGSPNSSLTL